MNEIEEQIIAEYKQNAVGKEILESIGSKRGLLWEKIAEFKDQLEAAGCLTHEMGTPQSKEMQEIFPLKHHFEGGMYTRELFIPQGIIVVSAIHKQQHPTFLLKGKLSYLNDEGEVTTITAPHTIFTQAGTQRVLFHHEDCIVCCVFKTEKTSVEEAELDVYANKYTELPIEVIDNKKKLCLEI
jgi:hypothetical protein